MRGRAEVMVRSWRRALHVRRSTQGISVSMYSPHPCQQGARVCAPARGPSCSAAGAALGSAVGTHWGLSPSCRLPGHRLMAARPQDGVGPARLRQWEQWRRKRESGST